MPERKDASTHKMGKLSFMETTVTTYDVDVGDDFDINALTKKEWASLTKNVIDGDPDEVCYNKQWVLDGMIIE